MGMSAPLEQLDARASEWLRIERGRGLVDVKFFPGCNRDVLDRAALSDFLAMMECREAGEFTDITDQVM
jgi:hypothetical protein